MYFDVLSDMVITNVRSVSTMYTPENVGAKRTNRPRWALLLKYEGETVYTMNGKDYVSNASHPVLLPRGISYSWRCTTAGHYTVIEFESEQTFTEPISIAVKHPDKLLKQFKELEYRHNLRGLSLRAESIRDTYSIILALLHARHERHVPSHKQQRLLPVIEYITRNYNTNITNDTLAAIAGMSTVYFRKQFTEIMGVPPIVWARQLRIEKAKEMLRSDYGTLSDIAQSLGYASLYDFSRDFKKHTGVSPSRY